MIHIRRHIAYAIKLMRHKYFVFVEGRKLGLGCARLVIHDWDKLRPGMWMAYARTFFHEDGTPRYQPDEHFAFWWNRHQKVSSHHWQSWLLVWDKGNSEALPMPDADRREMLADWRGAGRAYNQIDTRQWYRDRRAMFRQNLHPETWAWIEEQLKID